MPKRPPQMKDGILYGVTDSLFTHRWWNYYERALSFADGEFWEYAEADLREAIRQREHDQWRARTYGFHFIDYFPHRELGIVLYQQANDKLREGKQEESIQKLKEAIKELKISLYQGPLTYIDKKDFRYRVKSEKALLYLNKARVALVEKEFPDKIPTQIITESIDHSQIINSDATPYIAPHELYISLWNIGDEDMTYMDQVFIEGIMSAKQGVNQIEISVNEEDYIKKIKGDKIYFGLWANMNNFENNIKICGIDSSEKRFEKKIMIVKEPIDFLKGRSGLRIAIDHFNRTVISREPDTALSNGYEDSFIEAIQKFPRFFPIDRRKNKMTEGKLMAADTILFGRILERKESLEIYARIVDTETSEVLAEADVYQEDLESNQERALNLATHKLNLKLSNDFPVLKGKIVNIGEEYIGVQFKWNRHAKSGMKVLPNDFPSINSDSDGAIVKELGRITSIEEKASFVKLNSEIDHADLYLNQPVSTK